MNETDMTTAIYATEAEATRERIASTVDDLQSRLSPRNMMSTAMGSVRNRGSDVADGALAFAREHPAAVAGAALAFGVGLLLLNRDRFSSESGGYAEYASEGHAEYGADGAESDDSYVSEGYDADADDQSASRLSPRRMMSTTMGSVRNRGSDVADGALAFVREHPAAVAGAALALGVGLLLLNRDRLGGYSAEYNAYSDVYGEGGYGSDDSGAEGYDGNTDEGTSMMTRVRDTAASARSSLSDRASSARSFASDRWSTARERSADYAQRARARASTMRVTTVQRVHANPLGSVVTGLAAGALLGMLLPRTRRENELLGETRDRLAEAARHAAKAAADASRQQLDQMGVNPDAAKSKLADISQQAKEVARTAGQAAASELKSQSGTGAGTASGPGAATPRPTL